MQTHFRLPALFFISAIILLSSCSKTNKEGRYIPKTAAVVVIINGESLSAKLPWEEIKQNELFKKLYADTSVEAYIKTALENPDNTGIDIKKNLLFFAENDADYAAFEGTIKNVTTFKAFNSKLTGATEIEQDGIHILSNDHLTVSWDKEKFVIIMGSPKRQDAKGTDNATKINRVMVAAAIYSLKESNSLAKDDKFTELVSKKADIRFWMNLNSANKELQQTRFNPGLVNLKKLTEGSFLTGAVNFENGRIDIDTRLYSGKELTKINKEYSGSKINTDMIKRIPSKDPAMLFTLNFKPEGLLEILKMLSLDGFAGIATLKYGFTLDDFISANKGDILFAVSDVKKDSTNPLNMNALFAASIADKKSFDKLIKAADNILKDQHIHKLPSLSYNSSDQYFALGTDKTTVDKFISTANNNDFGFLNKISGGSSAFYLNFKAFQSSLDSLLRRDSLSTSAFGTPIKMWDNVTATGEFNDGALSQHIEITLADKNTNSLKQLYTWFGSMKHLVSHKKSNMNQWMMDAMSGNERDDIKLDSTK